MSNSALQNSTSEAKRKQTTKMDSKDVKPLFAKFGHQTFNLKLPFLSSLPAAPFTGTQSTIDFEIKSAENYYLMNDDSVWLYMKLTETGGSNSVTPTFIEALFDKNQAFEWMMNGSRGLSTPYTMLQTIIHPAVELTQNQYEQMCNLLNHNIYLSHGSQTAILASQTQVYWLRIPNPLPDDGFWLGALKDYTLRLRVRTQGSGTAIYAGSGTLGLTDMQLCLYCAVINDEEIPAMRSRFSHYNWTKMDGRLYEPPSILLSATGDITAPIQMLGLKDIPVKFIVGLLHTNRSFTATADYFNYIELPKTAKVYITDRSGSQIFTSNQEFYAEQRYTKGPNLFKDSKFFANVPFVYFSSSPNMQSIFHSGAATAEGMFWMTGDEYIHIVDSSYTTSGVYFDLMAFYETKWSINNGNICCVSTC